MNNREKLEGEQIQLAICIVFGTSHFYILSMMAKSNVKVSFSASLLVLK